MKKAILLDWDGVLCDSVQLYFDLYKEGCRRYNKVFPIDSPEAFRSWYNPRWEENYDAMGFSEAELREVQSFSESYLHYSKASLFPGVAENLRLWSEKYPLAIVSTTPSPLIRTRLAQDKLDGYFQIFTGGEDGCSEKRIKVKDTLAALGVEAGVMVGDTPLDVDAGRYNGLKTVGVTYGWVTPERVIAVQPDRLVNQPEELGQAVLDLMEG
jgi:HAD superfamily hydrolase (TIGR01549 family)